MKHETFYDWLQYGMAQGWCGPAVCETHDGMPLSEEEYNEFDEGNDPCINIIRLYEDAGQKAGVEENHSPSQWRASNQGLIA